MAPAAPDLERIDVHAIIEQNAQARAELIEAIDALPAACRLEPGLLGEWSLKDVLVHIAGWQQKAATVLGELIAGQSPGDFDIDAVNAEMVAEHAGESWDEVLAWLRRAREAYEAAAREGVERLTAEQLAPGAIVDRVLRGNGGKHDREHVAQILAWRREQGL
ncbi:MAG: maleylpyruvate isomerase N-terminal domain-containing protein [Dehalococcoidia bacterium]